MSTSDLYIDGHVFEGGPPSRIQRSLGLVKPDQPRVIRRALLAAGIAWIPLAILTVAHTLLFRDGSARWFFADFAVHARYLIAVPVLILAEADCLTAPPLCQLLQTQPPPRRPAHTPIAGAFETGER